MLSVHETEVIPVRYWAGKTITPPLYSVEFDFPSGFSAPSPFLAIKPSNLREEFGLISRSIDPSWRLGSQRCAR